jgi:hypothetical protein
LYELLTGTAPFDRVSLMQACAAVLEDEPSPPNELNLEVPAELSAVIMRCLRKDPNERYADVASLAEALSPFGSGRFASYAARCRAHLTGEGLGRRSTPTSFAGVSRQTLPPTPGAPTPARSITVRLESHAPLTRRVTQAPGPKEPGQPTALAGSAAHSAARRASLLPLTASQALSPAEPSRRVVATLEDDTVAHSEADDRAPFRTPRRRTVQAFAWGVPLVVGGLLATYLATAEQRARSGEGPRLHSVQPIHPPETGAADRTSGAKDSFDSLPSGSGGGAILGAASPEELAQAAGNAPPLAALKDAADTHAERERGLSSSAARSTSLSSTSKKPTDSKSKSRTRAASSSVKPAEIVAVPQPQSDPDVGF